MNNKDSAKIHNGGRGRVVRGGRERIANRKRKLRYRGAVGIILEKEEE